MSIKTTYFQVGLNNIYIVKKKWEKFCERDIYDDILHAKPYLDTIYNYCHGSTAMMCFVAASRSVSLIIIWFIPSII